MASRLKSAVEWLTRARWRGRWTIPMAGVLVLAGLAGAGWKNCMYVGCPDVSGLASWVPDQATIVLDADGNEAARLFQKSRTAVPMHTLPAFVPAAFVAMEDRRFESHRGVDWFRFGGALLTNVRSLRVREGASTITMQLARNLYPDMLPPRSRTPIRKLREMRVAQLIERVLDKRQILEHYLNEIYFGEGAYGVEVASLEYFGHPAAELTLSEAATLASLPRAPARYNPRKAPATAIEGRNAVLARMQAEHFIGAAEAESARAAELKVADPHPRVSLAPWFVEEVRKHLQALLGSGLYTEGYRVHTTLDVEAQVALEEELERQAAAVEAGRLGRFRAQPGERLQYAGVLMSAQTGDIRAMVGGRDFDESRFNRVTQAKRQPGSAFKPIVYAAALASGRSAVELVSDEPFGVLAADGGTWSPRNASGEYGDAVTLREALAESRNSATVRLAHETGMNRVAQLAERMGIADVVPAYASLPLGTVETTPLALTAAFSAFAASGRRPTPRLITRVEDRNGEVILSYDAASVPVLDPEIAFIVTDLMRGVVDGGTGWRVRQAGFRGMAAGKTGTSQEGADLWFAGITPTVAGTIWFGFDRPRTLVSGGSGGSVAAPVWGRVMARIANDDSGTWPKPPGVRSVLVDGYGNLVSDECPYLGDVRSEWVLAGTAQSSQPCPSDPELQQSLPTRMLRILGRAFRKKGND